MAKSNIGFEEILTKDTSDDELVTSVLDKINTFERSTIRMRRQWLINSAFLRGQQHARLHNKEVSIHFLRNPSGRKFIMDNMMTPWKDHMIANLVMAIPTFEAIPENYDNDAISAARMGSALLTHYIETWQFTLQYIETCGYLIDFGNALSFLNYEVDPTKHITEDVIDPEIGEQIIDGEGNPLKVHHSIGDITRRILMPHCIACPLDPLPLDTKPWVIINQRRSLDYFRQNYENGDMVVGEAASSQQRNEIQRISDVNTDSVGETGQANEIIYLQKPSDANPLGMMSYVAGNVALVRKGEQEAKQVWQYKRLMKYPIEHFHFPKESGEFFARSRAENQIPLQNSLNLLWSIIIENAETMGHIKTLIPRHANIPEGTIADINQVIYYTAFGGSKPEYMQPPPLPDFIAGTSIERIKNSIRDIQNYHGASLGGAVSGVRSDLHAQNLQEQDLLPLTVVDNIMKASFENEAGKMLMIAAEKITEERIISYTGKDKRIMYKNFVGAMLGDTKKVKARMTNTFMRTKNAVARQIFEYGKAGFIVNQFNQIDNVAIMKLLEFALPDSVNKDMQLHTEMAFEENDKLMAEKQVFVLPQQNHMLHLATHQEFMNGSEYMKLYEEMEENPENKEIIQGFVQHNAEHDQMLRQAMGMLQPRPEPEREQTTQPNRPTKQGAAKQ